MVVVDITKPITCPFSYAADNFDDGGCIIKQSFKKMFGGIPLTAMQCLTCSHESVQSIPPNEDAPIPTNRPVADVRDYLAGLTIPAGYTVGLVGDMVIGPPNEAILNRAQNGRVLVPIPDYDHDHLIPVDEPDEHADEFDDLFDDEPI